MMRSTLSFRQIMMSGSDISFQVHVTAMGCMKRFLNKMRLPFSIDNDAQFYCFILVVLSFHYVCQYHIYKTKEQLHNNENSSNQPTSLKIVCVESTEEMKVIVPSYGILYFAMYRTNQNSRRDFVLFLCMCDTQNIQIKQRRRLRNVLAWSGQSDANMTVKRSTACCLR